jgi:hypothetical protein
MDPQSRRRLFVAQLRATGTVVSITVALVCLAGIAPHGAGAQFTVIGQLVLCILAMVHQVWSWCAVGLVGEGARAIRRPVLLVAGVNGVLALGLGGALWLAH